jgi:hypothetical protein
MILDKSFVSNLLPKQYLPFNIKKFNDNQLNNSISSKKSTHFLLEVYLFLEFIPQNKTKN